MLNMCYQFQKKEKKNTFDKVILLQTDISFNRTVNNFI